MKPRTRSLASAIVALALCCASASALAMPKAAEDENAQVSSGIDAVRPKHSSAKLSVAGKAKPSKKSAKPKTSSKKTKSARAHK